MLLTPALVGATCSPSEPGCEFGEDCGDATARTCINFCAPLWEPEGGSGQICPLDPCAPGVWDDPASVLCPGGFICSPSPILEGWGTCRPGLADFGEPCNPDLPEGARCSEGACLPPECPRATEFLGATGGTAMDGVCMTPTRAGALCDSNMASGGIDPRTVAIPDTVAVPSSTIGNTTEEATIPVTWGGVRVYDVGSCSQMIRWPILANLLAMEVNGALDNLDWGDFGADPFTPGAVDGPFGIDISVRPLLRATPRFPLMLPHGPLVEADQIMVTARYSSPSAYGCEPMNLRVSATVAIRSRRARFESRKSRAEDLLMQSVGCTLTSDPVYPIHCTLPTVSGYRPEGSLVHDITTYEQGFSGVDDEGYTNYWMIDQVRCHGSGTDVRYVCTGTGPSWRLLNRAIYETTEAVDWYLELTDLDADIEDYCVVEPWLHGALERALVPVLDGFQNTLLSVLGRAYGASLSADYEVPCSTTTDCSPGDTCGMDGFCASSNRIDPDDLPPCGDPTTGPDDITCQSYLTHGGRRHRCSDTVTNSSGQYVCDVAQIEVRRMIVRPEGIELVFAEGPDDPQHDLLRYTPGLIEQSPPGEFGLAEMLSGLGTSAATSLATTLDAANLGADPDLCEPTRWGASNRLPNPPPEPRGVFDWYASSQFIPQGVAICADDDPSCPGICGQFGTTCDMARSLGLDVVLGRPLPAEPTPDPSPGVPEPLECSNGTCVLVP